jgi:hypothetical protein
LAAFSLGESTESSATTGSDAAPRVTLLQRFFVMPGLDPGIHAIPDHPTPMLVDRP